MKKLWFKRRRYGWGWTPVTTEGWTTLLVYLIAMVFVADNTVGIVAIILLVLLTIGMGIVLYFKGEKPRWQWGNRTDNTD